MLNMDAGEESDPAIVPKKRPNKGGLLLAEDVEERAWPESLKMNWFCDGELGEETATVFGLGDWRSALWRIWR
jgi:hypothetical protein